MSYSLLDYGKKELRFEDFRYLKNKDGKEVEYLSHPDVNFENVRKSLEILPDPNTFDFMCRLLSAILHIGNL